MSNPGLEYTKVAEMGRSSTWGRAVEQAGAASSPCQLLFN